MKDKRRYNITYKLRRKGYKVNIKEKVIYYPQEEGNPFKIVQIRHLVNEFRYNVQYFFNENN